jgi:hypothetical protein
MLFKNAAHGCANRLAYLMRLRSCLMKNECHHDEDEPVGISPGMQAAKQKIQVQNFTLTRVNEKKNEGLELWG